MCRYKLAAVPGKPALSWMWFMWRRLGGEEDGRGLIISKSKQTLSSADASSSRGKVTGKAIRADAEQ